MHVSDLRVKWQQNVEPEFPCKGMNKLCGKKILSSLSHTSSNRSIQQQLTQDKSVHMRHLTESQLCALPRKKQTASAVSENKPFCFPAMPLCVNENTGRYYTRGNKLDLALPGEVISSISSWHYCCSTQWTHSDVCSFYSNVFSIHLHARSFFTCQPLTKSLW